MPRKRKKADEGFEEPKKATLYTRVLTPAQREKLHSALESRLWIEKKVEYADFAYEGNKVNVVAYASGKLVVQGKATEDFVQNILEPEILGVAEMGYEEVHHPEWFELHAGCDEAGKGDIFGPLVTACVIAGGDAVRSLREAGVKDSKSINDREIIRLEEVIRNTPGVVVTQAQCSMEKYNELMGKPGANLNKLLAWLHAKSLGDTLDKKAAPWGLLDQFAKRDSVEIYLKRPDFELRRRTKAESDPVVAAASIVARAGFLKGMQHLSHAAGEKLMKGASLEAQKQCRKLRERIGEAEMRKFAKLHFKLKAG